MQVALDEVVAAVGRDSRIGPKFLKASVGFGGSCFQKDLLNLVCLCEHYRLAEPAAYWNSVMSFNDWQKRRFVQRMMSVMFNTFSGKRIAVLGFAFKKDTNDTRESPAAYVCHALIEEKAQLGVYDPQVSRETIYRDLERLTGLGRAELEGRVAWERDPYKAAKGAHALAVLTEWGEFKCLDFRRILTTMHKPAFAFDGRSILPHTKLRALGFEVHCVGRSTIAVAWFWSGVGW